MSDSIIHPHVRHILYFYTTDDPCIQLKTVVYQKILLKERGVKNIETSKTFLFVCTFSTFYFFTEYRGHIKRNVYFNRVNYYE